MEENETTWAAPKVGTLERIALDKLIEKGAEGVTYLDFVGTGINEDNIDQIINNIRNGMFESDDDHLIKFDA